MADAGEEKLIAVARHIAKTLGHTDTMAGDILTIFSNFDGRLREKLSLDTAQQSLNSLHRKLTPLLSSDAPIWSDAAHFSFFLHSVDRLLALLRDLSPLPADENTSNCVNRAEGLLQQSVFRLKEEFRTLIQDAEKSFNHCNEDDDFSIEDDNYTLVMEGLPAETIEDLREIAKRMAAAGYTEECSHVYVTCRWEFLEESLGRLGLQKFSIDEVQRMQWIQLEAEIDKWIKAVNIALQILYPNEQSLCDRVFSGLLQTMDHSFMEICRTSLIQLLSFADAVASGSRSPERFFKVLEIYETLRDAIPELELLFSENYSSSIREEAISIWMRLGEVLRGIFVELENLIHRDTAKDVVPGGGLHPFNLYIMNYLSTACRSHQTLEHIFEEDVGERDVDCETGENRALSSSTFATQLARLMELLEGNLEGKSKMYRDPALCSVFMMNNLRHIVQTAKGNELGLLLGDDWIRKWTGKIRQYHVKYQRSSWSKVLGVLKVETNPLSPNNGSSRNPLSPNSGSSRSLREKLKLFNSYFDEICKIQSSWVITDEQLREELRISVSGMVSPAYRSFIGRLIVNTDAGKHADRYIRYSVEDVEARLTGLFQGSGRR